MAAGCDSLFNLDHVDTQHGDGGTDARADGSADAPPDAPASFPACAAFSQRQNLQNGLSGSHDPQLSRDRLELFTARQASSTFDLYRATRSDTMTQFGIGIPVTELDDSVADDTDPALTDDGLMIVFLSNRTGSGFRAYQATRSVVGGQFTSPNPLPGLVVQPMDGLDLSADGLTIYFHLGTALYQATRDNRDNPFGVPLALGNFGAFPSMSPDKLAIYYNASTGGLVRRTRVAPSDGFNGTEESVDGGGSDGDMISDGTAIVLTTGANSDIVVIRECM
jgi:hypothetical protein